MRTIKLVCTQCGAQWEGKTLDASNASGGKSKCEACRKAPK